MKRLYVPDLRNVPTSRVVDTPGAQFGDLFLTEVARGCLWGCRFCAAGFVQRPYREVDLEVLRGEVRKGIEKGLRIGLVGPDTSDYTGLDPLTCFIGEEGGTFSPSSPAGGRHHPGAGAAAWPPAGSGPSPSRPRPAPTGCARW